MPTTFADMLAAARERVPTESLDALRARLQSGPSCTLVDVREERETRLGHIPGAVLLPRGFLEMRAAELLPDQSAPIVVYCAQGARALLAAAALQDLGYRDVSAAEPGFARWRELRYPVAQPAGLSADQRDRYSRHLRLPEVGEAGQQRLLQARVLCLGAGGLGSPAALYLAAAGVGTLGVMDGDVVERSNLQRQVLHDTEAVGGAKVDSARARLKRLNPDVNVVAIDERLTRDNVDRILDQGWDLVVDGLDNFATRYLLNDASVWKRIPVVHGSIFRFDGQVTTFLPGDGPCYRCLYPEPPPPELTPSCGEAGVLGVLPGLIGTVQATEAIKLLLGLGEPLKGRLLLYDSLRMAFRTLTLRRDPGCPVCGEHPTITDYCDYEGFCAR